MDKNELARRLMATFLGELQDQVRALNRDLLALEKNPPAEERAELLKALFRTAHSLKGASRSVNVQTIERTCHALEEILAEAREGALELGQGHFDVLYAVADGLEEAGRRLQQGGDPAGTRLAALVTELDLEKFRSGARAVRPAPEERSASQASTPPAGEPSLVRVPGERLDALLNEAGELLVAQQVLEVRRAEAVALNELVREGLARWRQDEKLLRKILRENGRAEKNNREDSRNGRARRAATTLDRIEENLRRLEKDSDGLAVKLERDSRLLGKATLRVEEDVRRLRMLPFAEACQGIERTVRDLSTVQGKEVDLLVEGGSVEVDRSVLEGLKAPLLHLVRNAVEHGVEPPEERRAAGKSPRGRVTISAALRGPQVEVSVADDGRGIDVSRIRELARRRGLDAPPEDRGLARLLFLPGFSTVPVTTEIAGRGVGLDVVRSQVELLRGTVEAAWEASRGTRFRMRVPLTLTTLRALVVAAGGREFIIPSSDVHRLARLGPSEFRAVQGRPAVLLGGAPVPVVRLAGALGLPERSLAAEEEKIPVVILAGGEWQAGFVVDELLSEQEVMVKTLGARLKRIRNISGATVLPNGRIALILNAASLVESVVFESAVRPATPLFAEKAPETKRLLVVDDSVTTRALVKSILEAAGYQVIDAADGARAWELLTEIGADLVVADVDMPRMDGFALTEAIRRSNRFRDLPVVLVTALESERDRARGAEVGAHAYLPKSGFDQTLLLETIAQLI